MGAIRKVIRRAIKIRKRVGEARRTASQINASRKNILMARRTKKVNKKIKEKNPEFEDVRTLIRKVVGERGKRGMRFL